MKKLSMLLALLAAFFVMGCCPGSQCEIRHDKDGVNQCCPDEGGCTDMDCCR